MGILIKILIMVHYNTKYIASKCFPDILIVNKIRKGKSLMFSNAYQSKGEALKYVQLLS